MATILKYEEKPLLTLRTAAPYFPCEGPPLPRFTGAAWPWATRNNIRALKGKGVVKHMLARLLPVSIPRVDVYVLKARMEGVFRGQVDNIGEVLLAAGDMENWLKVKAYDLLNGLKTGSPSLPTGQSVAYDVTFTVSGWSTVKELWDYMWYRTIDCKMTVNLKVPGYETADYTVEPYETTFDVDATLPVDEMNWHAW